ncbi:MAG: NAD(P)-dependent alcohol dehydrogenase [Alphaproteobacteria bacterium]|nr:NAD(P)-dependent alcohol dehydrogenase [Alphaproteobacteria bacterium]
MRVWEIGDYTKIKEPDGLALHIVERPNPKPGPGEVVMKVRATGINARDLTIMRGGMGPKPQPVTRVPLSDNAGDVLAVGPGVDRVTMTHYWQWIDGKWHGDMALKDYASNIDGFLAEQIVVPAEPLIKLPDSMSYEDASTLQSAGLTSWNAVICAGGAKPGDVVCTIGTGGVSLYALAWAKMVGATAIITSSNDAKLARMRELGADITINYRTTPNWAQEVLAKTGGRGADIVLNNVGVQEMEQCLTACASNGKVMYIGANPVNRSRTIETPAGLTRFPNLIMKDLTIKGIVVGSRRMFEDLIAAMTAHKVKAVIDKVFPFEQAREAVAYMESADRLGKVVIKVQ